METKSFFMAATATYLTKDNEVRKYEFLKEIDGDREEKYYDGMRECIGLAKEKQEEGEVLLGTHIQGSNYTKDTIITNG